MSKNKNDARWMAVRYVRFLTGTDPQYTVLGQLRERGKAMWNWYLDGTDYVNGEEPEQY